MKLKATKIENINKAKYGDILFFKPTSKSALFSRLIPIIDGSPFCHVGMYVGKIYGHHMFIESVDFKGVRLSRFENRFNETIIRVQNIPTTPFMALRDLGKPYDTRKILEILAHKIFGYKLTEDDGKALICSEAVNKWYNYKLAPKGDATPATIYNNLKF